MTPRRSRIAVAAACAAAALLVVAPAGAPGASTPRLYSAVAQNGGAFIRIFKVRPTTVALTCADGGTLVGMTWRRWTRNSASGSGTTRPCDGGATQAVTLFVSRPVEGYFTRMSVRYDGSGPNRLVLGHLGGRLFWLAPQRLAGAGPDTGPWPR